MAPGKKRLRMRGVKQASKKLEDDILARSREIADDPQLLRPMCAGNCRKCVFDKVFKDIDKVSKYKNSEDACLKFASKGLFDDMAKAYAGTISLSAAGKVPLLATAVIAGERVPYAVRGSVGADKLIGCQHYDDPRLRLLYYNHLIRKAGLHLYSFEDGLVCSDKPNMPEDYLYDTWWESPYKFPNDGLDCGHKGSVSLNIHVKSMDETIHICDECAKNVSTLMFLVSRLCSADPLDDFEVTVEHKYHSEKDSGTVKIEKEDLKAYMIGKTTDRMLIDKVKREKLGDLTKSSDITLIIGEKNYGSDVDGFLKDVSGSEIEKNAVRTFLGKTPKPLVLKNGKTQEALSFLWEEDWKGVIAAFTSDDFANRFTERPRSTPAIVLEKAYRDYMSDDVVRSLPAFSKPGYMTQIADSLAKAAKVGGIRMVMETAGTMTIRDSKARALVAAFILASDEEKTAGTNVAHEDEEFAQFLIPFAKKVIDADGKTYRDDMNTLLMACSSGESV